MRKLLVKLYKDQRGDSELIETSIALIFIFAIFIAFYLYGNAARTKVIMNYSAKEGARMYAITKEASEGVSHANSYLGIGGVRSANVSSVGTSGLKITNDLNVRVPFFNSGENLKLVSEYIFFEEYDPKYYDMGELGEGWYVHPRSRRRSYDDDSANRMR